MNIIIDTEPPVTMQPDTVSWQPPRVLYHDGVGVPVITPYWACSLGFSVLSRLYYDAWYNAWDGALHNISLPHPVTGVLTSFSCYVASITPRLSTRSCDAAAVGVDITLTKIAVPIKVIW